VVDPRLIGLPEPGQVIAGRYRIERLLGVGGMGAVFVAQHEMLGEQVALKLMLPGSMNDGAASARFVNEARAAAKIRGDHVVRVHDVGVLDDGRPFIAMELLEGEDLGQILTASGPMAPATVVDYLLQGMEAVAQAHARGIVHRDLKPSNFFLATRSDGARVVKVLDFGIAKTIGAGAPLALTNTKAIMGSPLYMSPEQIRRSKEVDPQSDVWALGIVAFELLTGDTPFRGENVGELILAIAEQPAPLVSDLRPEVPTALAGIVSRCLAKDKAARYATVVDLARALGPYASSDGVARAERVASAFERAARPGPDGVPSQPQVVRAPATASDAMTVKKDAASARTMATWSEHSVPGAGGRRLFLGIVGGGVVVGVVACLVWIFAVHPDSGPPGAPSAAVAASESAGPNASTGPGPGLSAAPLPSLAAAAPLASAPAVPAVASASSSSTAAASVAPRPAPAPPRAPRPATVRPKTNPPPSPATAPTNPLMKKDVFSIP
jgi:hypothetical protein